MSLSDSYVSLSEVYKTATVPAGQAFTVNIFIDESLPHVKWDWDLESSLTGYEKHIDFVAEFVPMALAQANALKQAQDQGEPVFQFFGIKKAGSAGSNSEHAETVAEIIRLSNHGTEDGISEGAFEPSCQGLVRLRWSNEGSMMRSKSIRYRVEPLSCSTAELATLLAEQGSTM